MTARRAVRRRGHRRRRRRTERGGGPGAGAPVGAGGRRGQPRNAPADGVHNYLGREGTPPGELLAIGRAEVAGYGGEVVTGVVTAARREDDGASAWRSTTAARCRRAAAARGHRPGRRAARPARAWPSAGAATSCTARTATAGRSATRPIGILATGPIAVHQALLFRQLSDDVTFFLHTGPELPDEEAEQLAARGVPVVRRRGRRAGGAGDRLTGVRLARARWSPRAAVVVAPRFTARADVLASLGLEATGDGDGRHTSSAAPSPPTRPGPPPCPGCGWRATSPTCRRRWSSPPPPACGPARRSTPTSSWRTPACAVARARGAWRMSAVDRESYDELYRSAPAVWSGRPNRQLVVEAADLRPAPRWTPAAARVATPCGSPSGAGGSQPWTSRPSRWSAPPRRPGPRARGPDRVAARGPGRRTPPAGRFDLVTAHYLHATWSDRPGMFRRLAPRSRRAAPCSWSATSSATTGATVSTTRTTPACSTPRRTSRRCSTRRSGATSSPRPGTATRRPSRGRRTTRRTPCSWRDAGQERGSGRAGRRVSHPAPVQSTSAPAPHARAALASLRDGGGDGGVMSTVEAKRQTQGEPAGRLRRRGRHQRSPALADPRVARLGRRPVPDRGLRDRAVAGRPLAGRDHRAEPRLPGPRSPVADRGRRRRHHGHRAGGGDPHGAGLPVRLRRLRRLAGGVPRPAVGGLVGSIIGIVANLVTMVRQSPPADRSAVPHTGQVRGSPRSASAAATASSRRASSTSRRCTSTPRRVSRRSAARSRGRAAPRAWGRDRRVEKAAALQFGDVLASGPMSFQPGGSNGRGGHGHRHPVPPAHPGQDRQLPPVQLLGQPERAADQFRVHVGGAGRPRPAGSPGAGRGARRRTAAPRSRSPPAPARPRAGAPVRPAKN